MSEPAPQNASGTPTEKLKHPLKVAVLGAGVVGLCTALTCARKGHAVHVFDPDLLPSAPPPQSASALAGGMLAPFAEIEHMNAAWLAAGIEGIDFWQAFARLHALGFARQGSLLIAHAQDAHMLARFQGHLQAYEDWDVMDAGALHALEPQLPENFRSGLHLRAEAHLNPDMALQALFDAVTSAGAALYSQAQDPDMLSDRYDVVIDARGMGQAVTDDRLRGVKGETLLVRNTEFSLQRPVRIMHPRYPLYVVPRQDHVFLIGATTVESADQNVSLRAGLELMSALYSLHPSFGEAEIMTLRAGVRPTYPDNLPRITRQGNLIRAGGLYRHGWLLAPVIAQIIADCLENRINRFTSLFERAYDNGHHDYDHYQRNGLHTSRRA